MDSFIFHYLRKTKPKQGKELFLKNKITKPKDQEEN